MNKNITFKDLFPLSRTPSPGKFFDVHSHVKPIWEDEYKIINLDDLELINTPSFLGVPVSVGYHPWKYDKLRAKAMLDLVSKFSENYAVFAIGECGIDHSISTPLRIQEDIFMVQACLAEQVKKPMIIHCVRAYSDFAKILKQFRPSVPWIFHGYNADNQTTKSLIDLGAYFSVGKDLLRSNARIRESIKNIPPDRLFLETDTWSHPVKEIYHEASKLTEVPEKDLKEQMFENFKKCFLSKLNISLSPGS